MYGLLLENMADFIRATYGDERWEDIRRRAGVEQPSFSVHQVYPENLIAKLAKTAQEVLGVTEREFMDQMGVYFVGFVSQYGYDRVLSVLGRHMRDFLNGLDNLHEYLKFSYPRMRAPSFICENETRQGLTLHYRSKRRGFVYYTMGQIREVARHFYHKEMRIELVREELLFDTVHVTFQLTFDNRAFTLASLAMTREEKHLPISASVLFEIFPFCIVFGSDMVVRSIGNSLMVILPDLVGKKITNWFDLVRPLIAFKFQTILNRTNNIFELVTVEAVLHEKPPDKRAELLMLCDETELNSEKNLRLKATTSEATQKAKAKLKPKRRAYDGRELPDHIIMHLKGQMIYMDNWRMMMYLGTPVMPDLSSLVKTGLYINDLSMHDFSRDLMLAGTQQSVELKLALDQEQQKSKKLEESMRKLDMEMKRTDELLYQMIPKQVADRLRTGENPIDTCEMFDSVSILFSDVVTFTEICSRITPMEVVSMLNAMYSIFDTLTERNRVYKVETIGDAYMVVSGAPEKEDNHAEKVCDMALDMVEAITDLKDPSTGTHLSIRVGVHSGAVVAGIVGLKMPRYCLFGDSVNTASRMESTSDAMLIHISQTTRDLLSPSYRVTERGEIQVKGKGSMKTYWLDRRESRTPLSKVIAPQLLPGTEPEWERAADVRDSITSQLASASSPSQAGPASSPASAAANCPQPAANIPPATTNSPPATVSSPSAAAGSPTALGNAQNSHSTAMVPVQTGYASVSDSRKSLNQVVPYSPNSSGSDDRRVYSPVTFQDVARRSMANSPVKDTGRCRETRSTSTGCASYADMGSGRLDLYAPPLSSSPEPTSPVRFSTAPASRLPPPVAFDYDDSMRTLSPSHSAPAVIGDVEVRQPEICTVSPITITDYESDKETPQSCSQQVSECTPPYTCEQNAQTTRSSSKVSRFKSKIGPSHQTCTAKDSSKHHQTNHQSGHSHGNPHSKHSQHHQCCGAFGNPHARHKTNSSCRIA